MRVTMLDIRDEDIELWDGSLETPPIIADNVVLSFGEEGIDIANWTVISRTFIITARNNCGIVLLLAPSDENEWDGSANAMVESQSASPIST